MKSLDETIQAFLMDLPPQILKDREEKVALIRLNLTELMTKFDKEALKNCHASQNHEQAR